LDTFWNRFFRLHLLQAGESRAAQDCGAQALERLQLADGPTQLAKAHNVLAACACVAVTPRITDTCAASTRDPLF